MQGLSVCMPGEVCKRERIAAGTMLLKPNFGIINVLISQLKASMSRSDPSLFDIQSSNSFGGTESGIAEYLYMKLCKYQNCFITHSGCTFP